MKIKTKMPKLIFTWTIWLFGFLICAADAINQFQLTSIFVDDRTLQLNRASGSTVENNDYLIIEIPDGVNSKTTATWEEEEQAVCNMKNGGQALKCEILHAKACMITLKAQQNLVIRGSISNFINPISRKGIAGMQATLFKQDGTAEAIATAMSLNDFEAADVGVVLEPSSKIIGSQGNNLAIKVTPRTKLTAVGSSQRLILIATIPPYFENAAQELMFAASSPDPCTVNIGKLLSCSFSRTRLLRIEFEYLVQKNMLTEVLFTVGNFNNPITESMGGFAVELLDEEEYLIARTSQDLVMSGINQPAAFKSWDFNFVDTAASGQWAQHQFILVSSMPIQKACRIKIKYPDDYKITTNLTSAEGSGFFAPSGGAGVTADSITDFRIFPETNSVEIRACKTNYGQFTTGILALSFIENQAFVHDSESFQIQMTEELDTEYQKVYQKLESGFIIRRQQQRPGAMQGKLSATSTLVQTVTSLHFELVPTLDLNGDSAYIVINVPKTLSFQGPSCTVLNIKGDFSKEMLCSRVNHQLTLSGPFKGEFVAAKAETLSMTVEEFLLPTSVQDIGTIQVITYDLRMAKGETESQYRPIDMVELSDLRTESGAIIKLSEVEVSSTVTSRKDQTYTFHYQLTHAVPLGGYFSIILSDLPQSGTNSASDLANGVKVSSAAKVKQNCYLVTGAAETETGLSCETGKTPDGRPLVNIKCTNAGFAGAIVREDKQDGTAKGAILKFRIKGLTNPRMRGWPSYFKMFTMDQEFRYIDQNFADQQFSVNMTALQQITSVSVDMANKTNGAVTVYTISIITNTPITSNDIFKIDFPKDITLPSNLECSTPSKIIKKLDCQRIGGRTVHFLLTEVDVLALGAEDGKEGEDPFKAGVEIKLDLANIRNAPSLRPSDTFANMKFTDSLSGQDMTEFSQTVIVTTKIVGILLPSTSTSSYLSGIKQDSHEPSEDSSVELWFQTNNPLPNTTAIVVAVPTTLPKLYTDPASCWIQVNGVKITDVCKFQGYQIVFENAFIKFKVASEGKIQLFFKTQNPPDNRVIQSQAYALNIFDSSELIYGVDKLISEGIGALYPRLGCDRPCKTCSTTDPQWCTECLPPDPGAPQPPPQFLHHGNLPRQTCVARCPAEEGWTSNGAEQPRRCERCADTCRTCAQNETEPDKEKLQNSCTSCQPAFPFRWDARATCHSQCPAGSYESSTHHCTTCPEPCKLCSDGLTCTGCFARSAKPNLDVAQGACVAECPTGFTPKEGICVPCEAPCATCALGEVHECLSCDNSPASNPSGSGGQWFRYGGSCLESCPIGTVARFRLGENKEATGECLGCKVGCELCDDTDTGRCLRCSPGLALFVPVLVEGDEGFVKDNTRGGNTEEVTCRAVCPEKYKKSEDGSVCERRTYPLDRTFVAFPILGTALFFVLITFASYWLTAGKSLVASTLIAFFGPIEMAAALYQFIYANRSDREFVPIQLGSLGAFVGGLTLNLIFVINFHKQVKGSDKQFDRWRKQKSFVSNTLLILSALLSQTLYRLTFSRLFRLDMLSLKVSRPQPFLRPTLIFTWIKFIVFNVPLIVVDVYGISVLEWGNQCFMTMIESCVLSIVTFFLMVLETRNRQTLIFRENGKSSDQDKIELLKDQDHSPGPGSNKSHRNSNSSITPDCLPTGASSSQHQHLHRGAISLSGIKLQLQNNVTMGELKNAEAREPPSPRTYDSRISQLAQIVQRVKKNKDLLINERFDEVLTIEFDLKAGDLRRCKSMEVIKGPEHNEINDTVSSVTDRSYAVTLPALDLDIEEKLEDFRDYLNYLKLLELEENNKGDQYSDPEDNNVYASPREPEPEVVMCDGEIQTDQDKAKTEEIVNTMIALRENTVESVTIELMKSMEDRKRTKKKRGRQGKRGQKTYYQSAIDEEDEAESERSNKRYQSKAVGQEDAMQVDKNQSAASLRTPELTEKKRNQKEGANVTRGLNNTGLDEAGQQSIYDLDSGEDKPLMSQSLAKDVEPDRIEGDLVFTDDEGSDDSAIGWEFRQRAVARHEIDGSQQISDDHEEMTQRNFNENEIQGNFERDWKGKIKNRDYILQRQYFRDKDGQIVNEKGYLTDEIHGDLRSRYTFNVLFVNSELIGLGDNRVELPLPYRLERYNFNPHQCFGNFDYDERDKPIILKDRDGHRIDKNLRKVNASCWLIDKDDNIIDNRSRIYFIKEQLKDKGDMPKLYNYEGREYKIKNIMGQFERHKRTKDIILRQFAKNNKLISCDIKGRPVNPKGYLIDEKDNIIDKEGNIIWRSYEIMYDEPMKIFEFTEFSINWIKGNFDHDFTNDPNHDQKFDLDGRRINSMGYLIDEEGNIIDVFSDRVLFRKEILECKYGQDAEIPFIFRSGKLKQPEMDAIEKLLQQRNDYAVKPRVVSDSDDMDLDDDDVVKELEKMDLEQAFLQNNDQMQQFPENRQHLDEPRFSEVPKFEEQKQSMFGLEPDAESYQSEMIQLFAQAKINRSKLARPQTVTQHRVNNQIKDLGFGLSSQFSQLKAVGDGERESDAAHPGFHEMQDAPGIYKASPHFATGAGGPAYTNGNPGKQSMQNLFRDNNNLDLK